MQTNQKAFTLIELLVMVLIIGILSAVALPQYQNAVEKTRLTEAIINTRTIYNALEVYRMSEGQYPQLESGEQSPDILSSYLDIDIPALKDGFHFIYYPSVYVGYSYKGVYISMDWTGVGGNGKLRCSMANSTKTSERIKLCSSVCSTPLAEEAGDNYVCEI